MRFPVVLHTDDGVRYGVTVPDLPGCFSAAEELTDLPGMAQEAVEVHFDGEDMEIPVPSAPEQWAADERFQGGYWMLVEIDLAKIRSQPVRLNVSLPEYLVTRIDNYAKAHHLSRSGFLAKAAEREMREG